MDVTGNRTIRDSVHHYKYFTGSQLNFKNGGQLS